jgi:hypothetical protein
MRMEYSFISTRIRNEAPSPYLPIGRHKAELPGSEYVITGSALTPLRESVTAFPAPAYGQEGGASSRLARHRGKQVAPNAFLYKMSVISLRSGFCV